MVGEFLVSVWKISYEGLINKSKVEVREVTY